MDTEELAIVPLTFLDGWGPLVTLKGENFTIGSITPNKRIFKQWNLEAFLDRLPTQCTSMGLFLFWREEIFHVIKPND